jgi:ankyrin repeat protein
MMNTQTNRFFYRLLFVGLLATASLTSLAQTLGTAVLRGDDAKILEALKSGEDVNGKNAFGVSLFVSACSFAPLSTIKLLLENGANVQLRNPINEQTTLMLVIRRFGDIQAIKTMLAMGADVNASDRDGWTAFMDAVSAPSNSLEITKLLIEAGAKIDAKTDNGSTALFWTTNTDVARLLLSKGANIDVKNASGDTPLLMAVNSGKLPIIRFLIESGANLDIQNKQGETALLRALRSEGGDSTSEFDISELLVAAGANATIADKKGETPLMHAVKEIAIGEDAREARHRLVQQLIEKGADTNSRAIDGISPLMRSASAGNHYMVRLLAQHGANPNATDSDGATPLFWALSGSASPRNRNATLLELIRVGANTAAKRKDGKTIFDLAESEVAQEIKNHLSNIAK